jgi:hypothetical protein
VPFLKIRIGKADGARYCNNPTQDIRNGLLDVFKINGAAEQLIAWKWRYRHTKTMPTPRYAAVINVSS